MVLVTNKEVMEPAFEAGYAVGAFNINNMEIVHAIVEAAVQERSPVILAASKSAIKYAGIKYLSTLAHIAAEESDVPVALHLDHGPDLDTVLACIRAGFTSIMIDGSKMPFEENVAITRKVVEVCHPLGIPVEAELGKLVGVEDDISVTEREASFTDPKDAKRFVEETGCDSLAVSIGNAHGIYKGEPKLDFDRLKEIHEIVDIPLVLHGASGIPDGDIRKATSSGISKINIDTELRLAFRDGVRSVVCESEVYDPRKFVGAARDAMRDVVIKKIRLFGSSGRV